MQRTGVIAAAIVLAGLVAGYSFLQSESYMAAPSSAPQILPPPEGVGQGAPPPVPAAPDVIGAIEPSAGPSDPNEPTGGSGPPMDDTLPPAAGPGGEPLPEGVPMAPGSTGNTDSETYTAANAPDRPRPPPKKNGHGGSKVISYFQHSKTMIDARRAFGFVLLPKVAVSESEKKVQKDFCETILATLDFLTPGAAGARSDVLATYWPIVPSRGAYEITEAFTKRNCGDLLAWYDHALARKLALKAGVVELTGPLMITWPSASGVGDEGRDPLIVDFSKANHERASKTLQYWFRQLKHRPELWTNRIREGTIRAELADAVNETAGVMLAVMAGKWESVTAVSASP